MTDNELRERFHRFNRALNRADALIEEWTDDPTPITRAEAAQMFSFVLALRGWEETDAQLRPTLRAVPTEPRANRSHPMTAPRYPLTVALPGGRVRHAARQIGDGPYVATLCGKRGQKAAPGDLPYCRACETRTNPIDQRTYTTEVAR